MEEEERSWRKCNRVLFERRGGAMRPSSDLFGFHRAPHDTATSFVEGVGGMAWRGGASP
jgi:hypothetical protein